MMRKVKLGRNALMVEGSEIAAYSNTFSQTVGLESRKRVAPSIHMRCSKIQSLGNKEEFRYHLPTYELSRCRCSYPLPDHCREVEASRLVEKRQVDAHRNSE